MATETQRSPLLQADTSQEGLLLYFKLLFSVFLSGATCICAMCSACQNADYVVVIAAAATQQPTDRRAPLAPDKTYSKYSALLRCC